MKAKNDRGSDIQRLIELQATAQLQIAYSNDRFARLQQELHDRFARIEERFAHIEEVLASFVGLVEHLPDVLREKIGFSPAKP